MAAPIASKNLQADARQAERTATHARPGELGHAKDLMAYLRDYARDKPEAAALWCLGMGFVLGWKLKPW